MSAESEMFSNCQICQHGKICKYSSIYKKFREEIENPGTIIYPWYNGDLADIIVPSFQCRQYLPNLGVR